MRYKLVIVDDDASIRSLFENTFSDACLVFAAAEGWFALELIKREKPGLVFLDIDMPGISGLDVLRRLKESGLAPVVWMLTGKEQLAVITEAINLGAAGYLTKPFEINEIRGILKSALMPEAGKRGAQSWVVKRLGNRDSGKPCLEKP